MSVDSLLRLSDVTFAYGAGDSKVSVLDDVNFCIDTGQRLALIGRSGSGKSTLMSILAGLLSPVRGEVFWQGTDVTRLTDSKRVALRRKTIGVVYQFHHLLPEFSAIENVMLPAMLAGKKPSTSETTARTLLEHVGLEHRFAHRPGELSGGERQRVAIARALASEPKVLLMDEPTGNLDETTADRVLAMLVESSKKTGTSLVIVTHDRRVAAQTDQQFELHRGQLRSV
ncbi:MAG TPA: lipoprotein-releasing system ATP-binding protein LolD [Gammaproteobacteria bacterium]|nr:lipoprotein-releasing system ATP-binding protein LolD [Gammaproteobacteria bacterium]